ncbi:hypothetical protein M1N56_03635 [Dehalococcoidia bacterium]|nr:hypothetical protein [Dehalococcoidia bacterium]
MTEERGTQLAELMTLVLTAYAGDAVRPASMSLITANFVRSEPRGDSCRHSATMGQKANGDLALKRRAI